MVGLRTGWLLLFLLFFLPAGARSTEKIEENRQRLEAIKHRIDQTAKDLLEKRQAAGALKEDLQTVIREEKRLRDKMTVLERESKGLQTRLTEKSAQVDTSRAQTARTEAQVRKRLAAIYKGGEAGSLRLFFADVSPARISENYDYFTRIVRRDRELLESYRQQLQDLQEAQQHLLELKQQRQAALDEYRDKKRDLRQTLKLKERLLASARQEEAALAGQLAELRERAARLQALIKKLESVKTPEYTQPTGIFAARKGSLPWPVAGRIRIGFGASRHPELGTLHDSQGIEIAISGEQSVAAVWPGQVIFADYFKGFGKMVILDHGDGYYTLYAQAARLICKVGDQVAGGEVLAIAGIEGGSGVYFEVRHHGVPLESGRLAR